MSINRRYRLWSEVLHRCKVGIWAIAQDTYMLLQLLYLRLVDSDLPLLAICCLHNCFEAFIQDFIFIPLGFDITLQLFVVFPCLNMKLVLDDLSFFNKDVHHDVNFFSYLVGLFFEKLEKVIPCHQGIL